MIEVSPLTMGVPLSKGGQPAGPVIPDVAVEVRRDGGLRFALAGEGAYLRGKAHLWESEFGGFCVTCVPSLFSEGRAETRRFSTLREAISAATEYVAQAPAAQEGGPK